MHDVLVFVVWRQILSEEKKNRVIMNIRELNKIIESDLYSISLQIDIISTVTDSKFISIIDAAIFFYQFRIRKKNKHKLSLFHIAIKSIFL